MACRKREFSREESAIPASLSEALLLATMCIVGIPVDVHIKDGSIYSGIFHTASVENGYGIVLKRARMTKKGKCAANAASGNVIETLVVLSEDLVQVVAKGIMIPANGVACNSAGDAFGDTVDVNKETTQKEEVSSALGNERQVGDDRSQGEFFDCDGKNEIHKKEITHEAQGSGLSFNSCFTQSKSAEELRSDLVASKPLPNGEASVYPVPPSVKLNDQYQHRYSSGDGARSNGIPLRVSTSLTSTEVVPPKTSSSTSKGFKLNPGAKVFCPSFANHRSATPPAVPTVANLAYVPDNYTVAPIASVQPDVEVNSFVPRSSLPVKFVPYGDSVTGNGISDSQYAQQFIGHVGGRTQSVRYGQHLHPMHAGPAGLTSNPQNVMVGRVGQLIYMHPVSHDANQAAAAFSQVSNRPLLTPHLGHLLKHQGTTAAQALQLCVNPPFISGGQQPYPVQSHFSHTPPPFPVIHPISVPGSNGIFSTKLS